MNFHFNHSSNCYILMQLHNLNIELIYHFPTECFYQNSYFSLHVTPPFYMCIICTFRCLTHLGFWMLLTMQSWKKWMFWTWALEDLISWISLLLTRFVQKLCLYWHSMFRNACSNKMVKICQNGQICKYLLILMKFHQICLFLWHSFLDISGYLCTHSLYLYTCESNSSSFASELSSDVHENSSVKKSCTRISLHVVTAQSCWKTFDKFCNLNEEEIIIKKNSIHNNSKGTM